MPGRAPLVAAFFLSFSWSAASGQDTSQGEKPPASPRSSHDREGERPMAPPTTRPVKQQGGRMLLWAKEDRESGEIEWFDVTDQLTGKFRSDLGELESSGTRKR